MKKNRLGDYINVKHGFAFKGENITDEKTSNILVTPGNFNIGGGFKSDKVKYYKGNCPEEYLLKSGDIVVTMTDLSKDSDTLGYSARIPFSFGQNYLHNQRIGLVLFKNDNVSADFLYWLLRSNEYHSYIVGSASGTSIMHTSPSRIEEFEYVFPSLPEQRAIASVLSSLDDKIDLLHRQNVTLEKMAETIFRQWFIEEAKEGWGTKPLSYIADFLNGLACQKYPPKNDIDSLPVLKIKDLSNGISENSDWASTEIKPEYIVTIGDVIFAWSASLMVKIWNGPDCILNQHLFKVTSTKYPKWYYYLWSKHHLAAFQAKAASQATTMGHIKRRDLDEALVLEPNEAELDEMSEIINPLFNKLVSNYKQIKTLTAFRDTLLPKLMSGEVSVKTK